MTKAERRKRGEGEGMPEIRPRMAQVERPRQGETEELLPQCWRCIDCEMLNAPADRACFNCGAERIGDPAQGELAAERPFELSPSPKHQLKLFGEEA